ncbi:MAG: ABC transporter permease [Bacteroidia bacterium]|nr:ABC transporter permease [Bacteroidia bacterium]
MITKLIWRNIWRNRRRTLITMSSVAFAVVLAVCMKSLQDGVFDNLVKSLVSYYSGYIQVHKRGYNDEQNLEHSLDGPDTLLNTIANHPNVSGLAARIETYTLAAAGSVTQGCMLAGIVPSQEKLLTGLDSKIISGTYLRESDKALLVSEGLAAKLRVGLGDTLVLLGQGFRGNTAAGMYPVQSIVHFGAPVLNESMLFLPLKEAQEFLSTGNRVTTIAVNIRDAAALNVTSHELKKRIGPELEVLTWKEMMPEIEGHIRADAVNFYLFIGVLYLLIAFGMFGTLLMMLTERKFELGMLMAIGMRKRVLSTMLVAETLLITFLGALAGAVISFPVVKYFEYNPIRFTGDMAAAYRQFGFDPVWPAIFVPSVFVEQTLIVMAIAAVISFYPLVTVYKLNPVEAMKR